MRAGLISIGEAQDAIQQDANPAEMFIASIRSAVLRGYAHLLDRRSNECPTDAERFGWRKEVRTVRDRIQLIFHSRGSMIGWIDREADAVYLDPASSYAVAQQLGSSTGHYIPTSVTVLGKRLLDAKRIVSTEVGRVRTKVYVNGTSQRAWHLRLSDLFPEPEPDDVDMEPTPLTRKGVA